MRVPRKLQIGISGVFHKMWKGHNREHVLDSDGEKNQYLKLLGETFTQKIKRKVQWHAYCLMGNHTHEVDRVQPNRRNCFSQAITSFSNWMRNAHSQYGIWYNSQHDRMGKVAYDRPKTETIENEWKVLKVMFYCDANPVRAGMVSHPSRYPYSSYRYYAQGKTNRHTPQLTPPPAYLALGDTAERKRKKYRQLCDLYLRQEGLISDTPLDESSADDNNEDDAFERTLYSIRIRGKPNFAGS